MNKWYRLKYERFSESLTKQEYLLNFQILLKSRSNQKTFKVNIVNLISDPKVFGHEQLNVSMLGASKSVHSSRKKCFLQLSKLSGLDKSALLWPFKILSFLNYKTNCKLNKVFSKYRPSVDINSLASSQLLASKFFPVSIDFVSFVLFCHLFHI